MEIVSIISSVVALVAAVYIAKRTNNINALKDELDELCFLFGGGEEEEEEEEAEEPPSAG